MIFWLLLAMLTSARAGEICHGITSKPFTTPIAAATTCTCTATTDIMVGPNVSIGDDVSLYAPSVELR